MRHKSGVGVLTPTQSRERPRSPSANPTCVVQPGSTGDLGLAVPAAQQAQPGAGVPPVAGPLPSSELVAVPAICQSHAEDGSCKMPSAVDDQPAEDVQPEDMVEGLPTALRSSYVLEGASCCMGSSAVCHVFTGPCHASRTGST